MRRAVAKKVPRAALPALDETALETQKWVLETIQRKRPIHQQQIDLLQTVLNNAGKLPAAHRVNGANGAKPTAK